MNPPSVIPPAEIPGLDLDALWASAKALPASPGGAHGVGQGRRGRPTPHEALYERLRPLVKHVLVDKRTSVTDATRWLVSEIKAPPTDHARWREFVRSEARRHGLAAPRKRVRR